MPGRGLGHDLSGGRNRLPAPSAGFNHLSSCCLRSTFLGAAILGGRCTIPCAGKNLQTFAKALCERAEDLGAIWRAVLVDQRNHGRWVGGW